MKIGILTFHRSINDGAVMQCYSLSKRLQQEFLDTHVEIIDYHMPKVQQRYEVSLKKYLSGGNPVSTILRLLALLRNPHTIRQMKARNHAFEQCINTLPLSNKQILSDQCEELFQYINENYDLVVAGSDAIWNYNLRGFPNPYFLSTGISIPKLSYAASCYGMLYENIPETQRKEIGGILNSYNFLGVRDDEAARFAQYTGCSLPAVHTCDPTVFLDVHALPVDVSSLESKMRSRGFSFDRETIGVMGGNRMCRMVRRLYGKKYQIAALHTPSIYADASLNDLTPYEWAYVFRYFRLTFTTFFHGTLLSLRNGVPVIAIALESDYSKKHVTKVQDFLRRIDMEDCYFHTDYQDSAVPEIQKRADLLLKSEIRDEILSKMDREAESAELFFQYIRQHILTSIQYQK